MKTRFTCLLGAFAAFAAVGAVQAAPVPFHDGLRLESHADVMRPVSTKGVVHEGLAESQAQAAADETVMPGVTTVQYYHRHYYRHYYHRPYYHHYYRHGIFIR